LRYHSLVVENKILYTCRSPVKWVLMKPRPLALKGKYKPGWFGTEPSI